MRGKRYETEKKIWGGQGGNRFTEKVESLPNANSVYSPKTSDAIADEYGVNQSTIIRNAKFSKVVDILPTETKNTVLSGAEKISRADTNTILKMDKPAQKKFLKEVEQSEHFDNFVKNYNDPCVTAYSGESQPDRGFA